MSTSNGNKKEGSYEEGSEQLKSMKTENSSKEDERYYFPCPLKNVKGTGRPRVPVTVCHKGQCLYLESEGGKLKCGYQNTVKGKK